VKFILKQGYLLVFFFFGYSIVSSGQHLWQFQLDSLKQQLRNAKADSTKTEVLLNIGGHYEYNNLDSAQKYFMKSYQLAKKTKDDFWQMRGLACLMVSAKTSTESKYYGEIGIRIAKRVKNQHAEAAFYNNLAEVYDNLGNMEQCLSYYQRSRILYEGLKNKKDTLNLLIVYGNILGVYSKYEHPKKAYELGRKALAIAQKTKDNDAILSVFPNYANILIQLKKYPEALKIIDSELEIASRMNNKNVMADALGQRIKYYQETEGQYDYLNDALLMKKYSEESDYGQGIAYADYYLSIYYFQKKNNIEARKNALAALGVIKKYELKAPIEEVNELLSHIELASGNMKGYHYYLNILKGIQNQNNLNKILQYSQEYEAKYSLNKKQEKINQLNKEKRLQQRVTILLSVVAIVLLLFALLFFKNLKQKQKLFKVKEELQQQKIADLEKQQQLVAADLLIKGQEAERERVARDLHDGLGGILSGVKFSLQNMKGNYIITEESGILFSKALQQLDGAISEMRRVAHNMMPESLIKFGLKTALTDFCEGISETKQLVIQLDCFGFDNRFDQTTEVTIYRIVQELVANVLKHAQAKQAIVQLVKNDRNVLITIEDDGVGFDVNQLQYNKNSGIANVKSRVNYLNGNIDIHSEKDKGTTITIEFTI
jgi:signal transduction histidine kinase